MRAAIAAESVGIPSVSIVCEGFAGQAAATARGIGYDGLPLAVTVGHVDAQSRTEMIENFVSETVDVIVAGLTDDSRVSDGAGSAEPSALEVAATGTLDEINDTFATLGWSDGNAILPPTIERVERFLEGSGHDPWKTLGIAPSSGRDLTVWSIAVNAVMAGCQREHLPILLALTEVLADPAYGAEHSGNTTGADALIILGGPNVDALGFNCGPGAQREGRRANTAVGRWLRLYLRNVFDFTADALDKSTFGNPARPVFAEDQACLDEIGWPSIAQQLGGSTGTDAVTVARMNSGIMIGSVFGSTPDEIIPYLANGIARSAGWDLTHLYGLGDDQFQPLLVLSPLLARTFAGAGWRLPLVQQALFEHARIPARLFEQFIGQWSNLTAGRRRLVDLAREGAIDPTFGESDDPNRLVPIVSRPDRIRVAVSGDPNRANAFAFSNDGPHGWWTTRPIDHTPASDLVCNIGTTCALPE